MKIVKAVGQELRPKDGAVVFFDEDKGTGMAVPLAAIPTIMMHVRRMMVAAQAAHDRQSATGEWRFVNPLPTESYCVETMPTEGGDRIILTIDPLSDVETPFSIAPGLARELGQALIEEADRATTTPTRKS